MRHAAAHLQRNLGHLHRPDLSLVNNFVNVFSRKDPIQTIGGPIEWLGSADRALRLPGVKNRDATQFADGHSALWQNTDTWKKVVVPELKKK